MAEVTSIQPQIVKPVADMVRIETRPPTTRSTLVPNARAHAEHKRILKLLKPQGKMR
jgi:hypothetical protein